MADRRRRAGDAELHGSRSSHIGRYRARRLCQALARRRRHPQTKAGASRALVRAILWPAGIQAIRGAAAIVTVAPLQFDQKLERSNNRMQTISARVTAATTRRVVQVMPRLTHQSIAQPIMTGTRISGRNGLAPPL